MLAVGFMGGLGEFGNIRFNAGTYGLIVRFGLI